MKNISNHMKILLFQTLVKEVGTFFKFMAIGVRNSKNLITEL